MRSRAPGGLFWKVFAACWLTAMLTGAGIHVLARLAPQWIELPPVPPSVGQSMLMPAATGAAIALLASGVLAWSLSRPLRVLRQAFAAAAAGRLEHRVAPQLARRHDEFAELARAYDAMTAQLQTLLDAQRRLLHDVSHELRSPLARLQVAVGLLQRGPEGQAPALRRIEREVERLDRLVGQVLALARLESGAPLTRTREVDVIALLASVADDARFEALAEGRDVAFTTPHDSLTLEANGELLLRAFENAVRNAVKHTPAGSRVEVHAEVMPGAPVLRVGVADRGPGVPAQALARIFEPFVRLDGNNGASGFGLGLAITRRAVEAHGGSVSAAAREGGGLRVDFSLPLSAQNPRHPP